VSVAQITPAGATPAGVAVQRIALRDGALSASVLTLGAILQSLRLAEGPSCAVGFPCAEDYAGAMQYCGAIVGPVAGRLSGAEALIGDTLWRFEPNDGRNLLHGGTEGLHARVWEIAACGPAHVTLRTRLRHCEGGFPGERVFEARYRLAEGALHLDLVSRTDRPTLVNLAPHAYFNLRGSGRLTGHVLRVAADSVLPIGPDLCPTGGPVPVSGPLDLRAGQPLDSGGATYDHCYCLAPARGPLRPVARLTFPGAPVLELATTEPGLQVHDAATHAQPCFGVALESQCWPDAARHPGFPSILLTQEGGARMQRTIWTLRHEREEKT